MGKKYKCKECGWEFDDLSTAINHVVDDHFYAISQFVEDTFIEVIKDEHEHDSNKGKGR